MMRRSEEEAREWLEMCNERNWTTEIAEKSLSAKIRRIRMEAVEEAKKVAAGAGAWPRAIRALEDLFVRAGGS